MVERPEEVDRRKAKLHFRGNFGSPEMWHLSGSLDAYSEAHTSYSLTAQALEELIRMESESDVDGKLAQIRRAITVLPLEVPVEAAAAFVHDVASVYSSYNRELLKKVKVEKPKLRPKQVVVDPEDEGGSDGLRRVVGEASFTITMTEDFVDENLRGPLMVAVTPYLTEDADPAVVASDLGLTLSLMEHPDEMRRRAALISLVAAFEAFVGSLILQLVRSDPSLLRGSPLVFKANDIVEAESYRRLMRQLEESLASSATRSFQKMDQFLVSVLGDGATLEPLKEINAIRNVLVHQSGIVSAEQMPALAKTKLEPGDRVSVSRPIALNYVKRLNDHAETLLHLARTRQHAT